MSKSSRVRGGGKPRSRRDFVKQVAVGTAGVALGLSSRTTAEASTTGGWWAAYPVTPSGASSRGDMTVERGNAIAFGLRTGNSSPVQYLHIYRQGAADQPEPIYSHAITNIAPFYTSGAYGPANGQPTWRDWQWATVTIQTSTEWKPGAYIAWFTNELPALNGKPPAAPATLLDPHVVNGSALFVVTRRSEETTVAPILYKIAFNTYHAYNLGAFAGGPGFDDYYSVPLTPPVGPSFYQPGSNDVNPPGYQVTMRRPGGGVGALSTRGDDPSNPHPTPIFNCFKRYDLPLIKWLEGTEGPGLDVDYCADLDIHDPTYGTTILQKYRVLLLVGHDEYWSKNMRSHVRQLVEAGGNVAALSGNTCWGRVTFGSGNLTPDVMISDRTYAAPSTDRNGNPPKDAWWITDVNSVDGGPENRLLGVGTRNAGVYNGSNYGNYTVQNANSWLLKDTNVTNGGFLESTPNNAALGLVDYEFDGAYCTLNNGQWQIPANPHDGTPRNFRIVAYSVIAPPNANTMHPPRESASVGSYVATMGLHTKVGAVFAAATTEWPVILPNDARVKTITKNVIAGFTKRNDIKATGHFNGDIWADLVCHHPDTRAISVWRVNGTSLGSTYFDEILPDPWIFVGCARVPGSTTSAPSLLYYNTSTRQTQIRHVNSDIANGGALTPAGSETLMEGGQAAVAGSGWTLVGAADFDGDGSDELIFHHSGGSIAIWKLGSTFSVVRKDDLAYPAARIVGAADFSGDGKADLVLFNSGTREIVIWTMKVTTKIEVDRGDIVPTLVGADWEPVAVGNMNGDSGGYPDIVFQNTTTRRAHVWVMQKDSPVGFSRSSGYDITVGP